MKSGHVSLKVSEIPAGVEGTGTVCLCHMVCCAMLYYVLVARWTGKVIFNNFRNISLLQRLSESMCTQSL